MNNVCEMVSPPISVVMCCYNAEKYIRETIDSVLTQTFNNFEFIIWNDGSTDTSEKIIKSYNDKRIRLYTDINRGEGLAANLACSKVRGRYIARIDSDDVWLPTKLEAQYNYMESNPNVVLLSTPVIFIDKYSRAVGYSFPITRTSYLNKSIKRENRFTHSASIYRTELYKRTGGYADLRNFQDWLLFNQLSHFGDLAMLETPLVKYRLLPNSIYHRVSLSPYKPIIDAYRIKIINELGNNEDDIKTFNHIFQMIGKSGGESEEKEMNVSDVQNKLLAILQRLIGFRNSYRFITFLMNASTIIR